VRLQILVVEGAADEAPVLAEAVAAVDADAACALIDGRELPEPEAVFLLARERLQL
jgi:hypothetical protein